MDCDGHNSFSFRNYSTSQMLFLQISNYTFSYVYVTSGATALVYSAFFMNLVDILNWKYLFLPLEWIGNNVVLVYVGTLLYAYILEALFLMKFSSFSCLLYKIRCSIVLETRKSFI
ncbi:hypothetical protein R3W88_004232 [Solanum pinnatisectum]|uniref:Uncharacterized protein n=1 Tax=Solanum pinnatisectum TaxID=50273 RepID=A0AAV9K8W6_9SOLN|nr:hypothetical protein R3W88_004232 [Solanum pinnatisectum]